jgi:hypothetical protein
MALVHHEPGWRLPRHTVLARRYNVSTAEIDAAIAASSPSSGPLYCPTVRCTGSVRPST